MKVLSVNGKIPLVGGKAIKAQDGGTDAEDGIVTRTITTYTNNRVQSIGGSALYGCSALTSVDFPAATTIGSSAFNNCPKLTSVNLPIATTIGNSAFSNCSALTSVDFPAATTIGSSAFSYCPKLTSVVLRKTDTICTLSGTSAFNNTPIKSGTGYIYVPDALVDQYKAATNWSTYAANIKPLSEYTEV